MKRPQLWGGIIGGILVVTSVYGGAGAFAHPTDLVLINVVILVRNLLWALFGAFLFFIYLRSRQMDDAGHIVEQRIPDSPEDQEYLKKQRNWIFGFVLLVEVISSTGTWILNDYTAGFTPVNVAVIFDVLFNAVFLYITIELFKNKERILDLLFYTVIIYALGFTVIDTWRAHWFGAALAICMAFYFIYGIKAPLNRKNHRITHLVLLPLFIVLILASGYFDNGDITELSKNDILLEQQFLNEAGNVNAAYSLFLEREVPDVVIIQDVKKAIIKRDVKIREIILNFHALQAEYQKQLPGEDQQKTLERIRYFLLIFDLHQAQADKVTEFMNYAEGINFANLSDEQQLRVSSFKDEVEEFNTQITEVQFKLNNSNL